MTQNAYRTGHPVCMTLADVYHSLPSTATSPAHADRRGGLTRQG
jgi:proteasome lid subunit RPN8/RPN11